MIKIIEITFEELKRWVDSNYSEERLKTIFLNYVDRETIDRIERIERIGDIWELKFALYLKGEEEARMKDKYYLYDWENSTKDEILDEFEFNGDRSKIEILFASYTYEWYEGEAFLIVEKDNKLYEVNANHCSCYGLENQFDLEETSIEQLEFYLEKGHKFRYYYGENFIKKQLVDFIKNYKEKENERTN